MNDQLLITDLLEYAALNHGQTQIVSRSFDGSIHRYTYRDALQRSQQVANALVKLGIKLGDRVGTLAWNTHRHYELYFAISGLGAITHTINPRLSDEQISYIINHAEDNYIFVDLDLIPILERLQPQLSTVKNFVVLVDSANMPETSLANVLCYEQLLQSEAPDFEWPQFSEETAASLCYTSGTTGNPKGVLYSHRSTVLHARAIGANDAWGFDSFSAILPVVPMFHASAWGIPYATTMLGSKLVLPGSALDGASLHEIITTESVSTLCGVPTVWQLLLEHMNQVGQTLDSVKDVIIGGAPAPLAMIRELQEKHDVFVMHSWGMTEISPTGAINYKTPILKGLPEDQQYQLKLKQGKPPFGLRMRIIDDQDVEQPRDGKSYGRLLVRGPWVATSYYKNDDRSSFTEDGWLDTGDIATLDENGYMQIVDRAKDIIKSGGEWVSSIEVENAASQCENVTEACVIGVNHRKWGERPILLVTADGDIDKEAMLKQLSSVLSKISIPNDIILVDELPHNATGKLMKQVLRDQYKDYLIDSSHCDDSTKSHDSTQVATKVIDK